ncbi:MULTISPECIES: hypothetical protein [unclassified Streptomyces]|uniref:hypothetical protein n=1 Tax=unclassified Streptomyces TaxID=2593676 RepID=UPI0035D96D6E
MKPADLLVLVGVLGAGAALAYLLGGGFPSQAVLALAAGGGGAFVGTRIKNRKNSTE